MIKKFKIFFLFISTAIPFCSSAQLIKWERVYGSTEYEYGRSIQQTIDGAYIVAGTSSGYSAATDMYLLRLNGNGSFRWHKVFGGGNDDWCMSVKQTRVDSGFILCGYTNSMGAGGYDIYLVKTDSLGNELWHKTYGGTDWDFGFSVDTTSDGGYIITGGTYSFGNGGEDAILLKTDANGNEQWYKTYGGFQDENTTEVHQTFDDGGYILSGRTKSFSQGDYDCWIIKTDPAGDTLWTHTYGSPYEDVFNSVKQTPDSGYCAAGYTYMNSHTDADMYARKLNKVGATQHILNDIVPAGNDLLQSIWPTLDGCYFTVSSEDYIGAGGWDFHFVKWDPSFFYLTGSSRGGASDEFVYQGQQTLDTGYVMVGNTETFGHGKTDMYIVKIDNNLAFTALPLVGTNDIVRKQLDGEMNVFPNPVREDGILSADEKLFSGKGSMRIADVTGREVYRADEQTSKNIFGKIQFKFSVNDLSDGIYLLSLESDAGVFTRKFVVKH